MFLKVLANNGMPWCEMFCPLLELYLQFIFPLLDQAYSRNNFPQLSISWNPFPYLCNLRTVTPVEGPKKNHGGRRP
jgi:hypothetical protein